MRVVVAAGEDPAQTGVATADDGPHVNSGPLDGLDKDEAIEVQSVGGRNARTLSRQILCEIIEPRVEEIFALVKREIQRSGYEDLVADPSGCIRKTAAGLSLHGDPDPIQS